MRESRNAQRCKKRNAQGKSLYCSRNDSGIHIMSLDNATLCDEHCHCCAFPLKADNNLVVTAHFTSSLNRHHIFDFDFTLLGVVENAVIPWRIQRDSVNQIPKG